MTAKPLHCWETPHWQYDGLRALGRLLCKTGEENNGAEGKAEETPMPINLCYKIILKTQNAKQIFTVLEYLRSMSSTFHLAKNVPQMQLFFS